MIDLEILANDVAVQVQERIKAECGVRSRTGEACELAEAQLQRHIASSVPFDKTKVSDYFEQFPEMWNHIDYENSLVDILEDALRCAIRHRLRETAIRAAMTELDALPRGPSAISPLSQLQANRPPPRDPAKDDDPIPW
ncbi:hypothetical protein O9X98_14580 [Agrobacterium salinitolerans]|nr:hypothetical protein [Agrobacterium salinitolerans]